MNYKYSRALLAIFLTVIYFYFSSDCSSVIAQLPSSLVGIVEVLYPITFCLILNVVLCGYQNSVLKHFLSSLSSSARLDIYSLILDLLGIFPVIAFLSIGMMTIFTTPLVLEGFSRFSLYSLIESRSSSEIAVVSFVLCYTYFDYWNHRIGHSAFFWPLHRYHHTATTFTLITSHRNTPSILLLEQFTRIIPLALFKAPQNVLINFFVVNAVYQLIIHTNNRMSWGGIGKYILLDPDHHKIHHSLAKEHIDKNFGTIAFWDHLHGTYYAPPKDEQNIVIGVQGYEFPKSGSIFKIYIDDYCEFLTNAKNMFFSFFLRVRNRVQTVRD